MDASQEQVAVSVRLTLFYTWSRRASGTGITAGDGTSSPGLGHDMTAAVWSVSPGPV